VNVVYYDSDRETRIKELVAIVRAAQVQGVKQTEMLTMITGFGDQ